jgi:hypothetical protein
MNALIVPIHLQKMNWAMSLLTSLNALKATEFAGTTVLVASNDTELSKISEALLSFGLERQVTLVDANSYARAIFPSGQVSHALETNANRGVVNLKKFIGLHWAFSRGHEASIAIDNDIFFASSCNLDNFFRITARNYASNRVLGVTIPGNYDTHICAQVNARACDIFSPEDVTRILDSRLSDTYVWFMDPPFYSARDTADFFDYMAQVHGSLEQFFLRLNWHTFDNVVFNYYRALHKGLTVESYSDLGITAMPEWLTVPELDLIRNAKNFEPVWIPFFTALALPAAMRLLFPDIGVLYHFDRVGRT